MSTDRELLMPGTFADYCGQRWKVGAVGITGGERYYWLTRSAVVLMTPATLVTRWIGKGRAAMSAPKEAR